VNQSEGKLAHSLDDRMLYGGACGAVCPASAPDCNAGGCICPSGIFCGDTCVSGSLKEDENNCGACGHVWFVRLNDAITTTPEHHFYGDWVPAEHLAIGDPLLQLEGPNGTRETTVQATNLLEFSGDTTTYNFEVAIYHDYFAGGLLVHNVKPSR
jgi:hypothetical protein